MSLLPLYVNLFQKRTAKNCPLTFLNIFFSSPPPLKKILATSFGIPNLALFDSIFTKCIIAENRAQIFFSNIFINWNIWQIFCCQNWKSQILSHHCCFFGVKMNFFLTKKQTNSSFSSLFFLCVNAQSGIITVLSQNWLQDSMNANKNFLIRLPLKSKSKFFFKTEFKKIQVNTKNYCSFSNLKFLFLTIFFSKKIWHYCNRKQNNCTKLFLKKNVIHFSSFLKIKDFYNWRNKKNNSFILSF